MLLPSDVARLILGYLQQEKLFSTCKAFITESPHLKEYAEHHTDEGAIPGCLLSLFGKNLITILNEYVTMKAKENEADLPFMMSSLWKKLDLTLSQIRCMQESAAFQTNQNARTRKGINERVRQKMLTSPLAVSGSPLLHPVAHQISTPVLATQYILCPINTPGTSQSISSMSANGSSAVPSSNLTTSSIVVTTPTTSVTLTPKKLPNTATSSPMRRKPDTQRRRRMAPISGSVAERDMAADIDSIQGLIEDDFPQLVIENAREKILSNKCLQEKLAENINKILASDSAAQTSKQGDGTAAEQDPSIDEILGLQGGEIHMSEEAIQDILVQTELDPDFQELYDLFACVSSKAPKSTARDPSSQNVDAKTSASEKSKKLDDVNCRERAGNKMDGCLRERETDNSILNDLSEAESSLKEKADGSSNLQQTCVNETTTSGSPKVQRQSSDLVLSIESSDDTVMQISKESHQTVLEASYTQPEDVEMEIISPTNEGTDDCCFIVEDVLPQTLVNPEKSGLTNMCLRSSENEELTKLSTSEGTTNEKLSDKSQQESNKTVADLQPSTVAPQDSVLFISASAPALNCPSAQNEKDHQSAETSKISHVNNLCHDAKDKQGNESDSGAAIEKEAELQKLTVTIAPAACHGQNSLGPDIEPYSVDITVPSSSQAVIDPSTIVTLDIITEDLPEESELHNAATSIHEENYPTIILSPLVKNKEIRIGPSQNSSSGDFVEPSVVGEQCQLLATSTDGLMNTNNISNGDCTVYAVSGTSTTTDGGVIQLMPTSGSSFAPPNSLFISSCVASNVTAKQPNIMMMSNSSAPNNSQKQAGLFQTPPRPGSVYTVGQTISPKLSKGSTIILASPVQPVLQGVMSMFPISLVGQGGTTFTTQPHQILHVPISKPVVPKLPLPPKSQKSLPKSSANTGKPLTNPAADSMSRPSGLVQRENEEKNSTSVIEQKPDERALPETLNAVSKSVEAHRRVLCFDGTSMPLTSNSSSTLIAKSQKDKDDTIQIDLTSTEAVSSKLNFSKETRKTESSTSSIGKSSKVDMTAVQAKDQSVEKRPTNLGDGYGVNKENVLQVRTQIHSAGLIEKKASGQDNIRTEKNGKPQEPIRKQTSLPNILRRTPQKKSSIDRVCSTSPLAKQASQLLQDMQFHSPNTKPRSTGDVPRTPGSGLEDKLADNNSDHTRTPTCRNYNEDGGTPKPMMPPATPDLPTCSPASEAGSENSVNMAAHTLMILSRASIAKASSSTPLKDNTHQSKPSKSTAKKRRLEDSDEYERRSHRKELLSPSSLQKKKKMKKHRKKSSDNFPAGMDVEKFLMSLHYDE
ncbi:PREDICTED: protein NPAT [Nanorana parkeri]|uniref:protein NPAT n=1 Tax=Nanorana parkeri TaxID=125878 RepID=UPI00085474B0|nr:PREDICTED: protein NPAT [Nanorana parkeri]